MSVTANRTTNFLIYKIDNDTSNTSEVNINTSDITQFTNRLFSQFLRAKNKRNFIFKSDTTEVAQAINNIVINNEQESFDTIFETNTLVIANRLLGSQKEYARRYPGIHPPKNGCLVTIFSKSDDDDQIDILLSKIDLDNFLSIEDSLLKAGLPENNATHKSCSITFQLINEEYVIKEIILTDTNTTISQFWSKDFLELEEINGDEKNTQTAFNAVENLLTRKVKKVSASDHTELRNLLVGYFKTNQSFKIEDLTEYMIGSYTPEFPDLDIENIKTEIENLPNKKGFDSAFDITPEVIKARFKRTYKLSDKIELRTTDFIQDLKDVIIAKENGLGEKVLEIKNIDENIYNAFKTKED